MKITITDVVRHGSISAAIIAKAQDHDSIASGIIGPAFSTSGPGPGWQRNHDVSDYAARALDEDYGAASYIDADDGREATRDGIVYYVDRYCAGSMRDISGPFASIEDARAVCHAGDADVSVEVEPSESVTEQLENMSDGHVAYAEAWSGSEDSEDYYAIYSVGGQIEWSEESVVEIVLPSVEQALGDPAAYRAMCDTAEQYGADMEEWEKLQEKVRTPYEISGSGGREYAETLGQAAEICEDWYDFLVEEKRLEEVPAPDLDHSSLESLLRSIGKWEQQIAEALGAENFSGHGSYFVSAADRAGLDLTVAIRE